MTYKALE